MPAQGNPGFSIRDSMLANAESVRTKVLLIPSGFAALNSHALPRALPGLKFANTFGVKTEPHQNPA